MADKRCKFNRKIITAIAAALMLLIGISTYVTIAFMKRESKPITNKFVGTATAIEVSEDFNGTVKKNVTATNTGKASAYIRIQLESHRENDAGNPIGGADLPTFTPGTGWLDAGNGLYIYSKPVKSGEKPAAALIGSTGITLQQYTDDMGGKQVVTVVAESVQASPADAVKEMWNVNVAADATLSLK